jgi:mannose-6-phosphate isomerase-like protein (cupin superfamily)
VERFRFDDVELTPQDERVDEVTVVPLTAPLRDGSPVQAAIFRVGAGGGLARHPATVPQILAVLAGGGEISGADGAFEPIVAGEAVFWPEGEEHETRTARGLTALIIEGEGLKPHPAAVR